MGGDGDTLPLPTDAVIGQVVKHVVKAVAAKQTILNGECTIDSDACTIMEV